MHIRSFVRQELAMVALLTVAIVGCEYGENTDRAEFKNSEQELEITGAVELDGDAVAGTMVALINGHPDSGELIAKSTTDAFGHFSIIIDEPGAYTLIAGHVDSIGAYRLATDEGLPIEVSEGGTELGTLEMFVTPSEGGVEEWSTIEAPIGAGIGCLKAGCSTECIFFKKVKAKCCGYDTCIGGFQMCIPYGKC